MKLRKLVKTGVAWGLHRTGADRVVSALAGLNSLPLVIGYHQVVEDIASDRGCSIPANLISRRMLERHLDWFGRRYHFLSLDEVGARLESGEPFDKPAMALTFDDGYAGVYHYAFPLLKRKGIPAALFLVTDLIGTTRLQIYDKLHLLLTRSFSRLESAPRAMAKLPLGLGGRIPKTWSMGTVAPDPFTVMRALLASLPQSAISRLVEALDAEVGVEESALHNLHALNWDMVFEMNRAGITIGSHTKTHALLTNESMQQVQEETLASREALESRLGTPIQHFAYPDGRFNTAVVSAVACAGYRFGYTTCVHRDRRYPLLTIPRKFLFERSCIDALGQFSPSIMSCQVHWVFDVISRCRLTHELGLACPARTG